MDGANIHRQARLFESHWHEDAALGGFAGLAAHPARRYRGGRPHHQYGTGRGNLGFDLVVELLAR